MFLSINIFLCTENFLLLKAMKAMEVLCTVRREEATFSKENDSLNRMF